MQEIYIPSSGREILIIKQHPLEIMSGNSWSSKNVGAKLLSDSVIFSISFVDSPLDFDESLQVVSLFFSWYNY